MPARKTIVTYLEMRARPRRDVSVPALPLAIIRANAPTVHFYRYLYDTVGGGYLWVDRRRLKDEVLAAIVTDPKVELYVIYCDGVPAGYGEIDLREADRADLAYFGLMPEFVGRGIGRYFLDQLIAIAWSRPIARMTVNTCTLDHPSALPLYQKAGFSPYDRREATIRPPARETKAKAGVPAKAAPKPQGRRSPRR